ncbi:MAG: flagellar hook-basal body protein [Candidatus Zixiibacteriota bacterium]
MIKGLYKSASAMIPRIRKQETIANNLANVSSAGYKKDTIFTKELSRAEQKFTPRRTDWQTPMIDQVYTSFSQGSFDKTGNPLDLAIEGDGFFAFETANGDQLLSRAGNLTVSNDGFIVNVDGDRLLGDGGTINVGGGEVAISETGIVQVDGAQVATVSVVDVDEKSTMMKVGNTGYVLPDGISPRAAANFVIKQGYLESSNVEIVNEMVDMITSYRNYEADSKSIKAQDESLEKLFANVGRVR